MRLSIHTVGRMKSGPARELLDLYSDRCAKAGRQLGIRDFSVREYTESRAVSVAERKRSEAQAMLTGRGDAQLVAFDENGEDVSSSDFAAILRGALDSGMPELAFAIGGPDGHGQDLLEGAGRTLRLGRLTWPHQLVRVMAAEQIYRAITILSGHPYHRE